jgi:hypothetical protein
MHVSVSPPLLVGSIDHGVYLRQHYVAAANSNPRLLAEREEERSESEEASWLA